MKFFFLCFALGCVFSTKDVNANAFSCLQKNSGESECVCKYLNSYFNAISIIPCVD